MRLSSVAVAALLAGLSTGCSTARGFFNPGPEGYRGVPPSGPPPSLSEAQRQFLAFSNPPLTPNALRRHVEVLASDDFEGRAPGTPGEDLTIGYISRAFSALGLQPGAPGVAGGEPRWTQETPLITSTVVNAPTLTIGDLAFAYGTDFVAWSKRLEDNVALSNAELVFVGYGVVSPELGWNDYAGLDMTGKIAVILVNDPDFATGDNRGFGGRAMTYFGRWSYKFEEAARQGAAGALIIHESDAAGYGWPVVATSWTGPQHDLVRADRGASRVAVEGWIQQGLAQTLFARAGLDLETERRRAQRPDFSPISLNQRASIALQSQFAVSTSHNVIGVLPGRERPNEAVIYSAHWDHLGRCAPVDGDDICNGALDNASGVAGLIEIARRFASEGPRERSLAFVAFTAEESGLLGSQYYAEHPVFAPADTVALINMDGLSIVGPARDMTVVGYGQNQLQDVLAEAAAAQGRVITREAFPERGGFYRSDHFNLAKIGVPVLFAGGGLDLYEGGVERGRELSQAYLGARYHKPDDEITPDWDLTGAMRDLQVLHTVGRRLADSEDWPNYSATSEFRPIRDASRAQR